MKSNQAVFDNMRSRFWLYALVLINGALSILSAFNLSANVFVLKASRFYPVQAWSLDLPQQALYYSPLFFPLWIYVLLRTGNWQVPRGAWPWALALVLLSLATSFPFAQIDLGLPADADTTVIWRHYWQMSILAGLAQPASILFLGSGLYLLLRQRNTTDRADRTSIVTYAGLALVAALLLRVFWAGPALPRLEDEVAYHIQALIFEQGALRGQLATDVLAQAGLSPDRLAAIVQLPYVVFDTGAPGEPSSFFSAHFHGWSLGLALLSFLRAEAFANLILSALGALLFVQLIRVYAPPHDGATAGGDSQDSEGGAGSAGPAAIDRRRIGGGIAFFLYVCAPMTVILSGTYMSHTPTQTLLLALCIAHAKLLQPRQSPSPATARGSSRIPACLRDRILWTGLLLATLIGLVFLRLQAALPAVFALVLADAFRVVAQLRSGRQGTPGLRPVMIRVACLIGGTGLALLLYARYSSALGVDSLFYTRVHMDRFFEAGCQAIGWGPGHGCFPTYGTLGHSFRKFVLNTLDLMSTLNHELSPGGLPLLPLAIMLGCRHWRAILRPGAGDGNLLLVFLAVSGVYCLYFHNGGESYRGRYIFEASFGFYFLLGRLCALELARWPRSVAPPFHERAFWLSLRILAPVLLVTNALFMMRGEYFSKFIQPYHSVNDFASPPVRNAVISVQDLVEQHADRDARTGAFYYPNEFAPGKPSAIALRSMKAFLNLGYGTLAATAVRLDERGFLRDAYDNVLIGDASPEEIAIIQRSSGAGAAYRLRYLPPDTIRFRRGLVYWVFREPELKPL